MTAEVLSFKPLLKLHPCPFCGSAEVEVETGIAYIHGENAHDVVEAYVHCTNCLAQGPLVSVGCRDDEDEEIDLEDEAIAAWTERHP